MCGDNVAILGTKVLYKYYYSVEFILLILDQLVCEGKGDMKIPLVECSIEQMLKIRQVIKLFIVTTISN